MALFRFNSAAATDFSRLSCPLAIEPGDRAVTPSGGVMLHPSAPPRRLSKLRAICRKGPRAPAVSAIGCPASPAQPVPPAALPPTKGVAIALPRLAQAPAASCALPTAGRGGRRYYNSFRGKPAICRFDWLFAACRRFAAAIATAVGAGHFRLSGGKFILLSGLIGSARPLAAGPLLQALAIQR